MKNLWKNLSKNKYKNYYVKISVEVLLIYKLLKFEWFHAQSIFLYANFCICFSRIDSPIYLLSIYFYFYFISNAVFFIMLYCYTMLYYVINTK